MSFQNRAENITTNAGVAGDVLQNNGVGNLCTWVTPPPKVVNFMAYLTAAATNVTGAGATYTLSNLTELYDVGNNLNATTGVFTVPITGYYVLMAGISLQDLTSAMTSANVRIRNNVTSSAIVTFNLGNPWNRSGASSGQDLATVSYTEYLTVGDEVEVRVTVLNGAGDTAGINAGRGNSYFGAYLLST